MPVPLVIAAGAAAAGGAGAAAGGAAVAGTAAASGAAVAAGSTAAAGTAAAGGVSSAAGAAAKKALSEEAKKKLKEEFEKRMKDELKNRILNRDGNKNSSDDKDGKKKNDNDNYKKPKKGDNLNKKDNPDKNGKDNDKGRNNNSFNPMDNLSLKNPEKVAKQAKDLVDNALKNAKLGNMPNIKLPKNIANKALNNNLGAKKLRNGLKNGQKPLTKNRLGKGLGNNLRNLRNNLKKKISDRKEKAKRVLKKGKKAVKTVVVIHRLKRALPFIFAFAVLLLIVSIPFVTYGYVESLLPGINGDVKEEDVITQDYSRRDQKVIDKIQKIVNDNPNASRNYKVSDNSSDDDSSTDDSSNSDETDSTTENSSDVGYSVGSVVMSAVAYPYYSTLQSDDIRLYYSDEEETDDEEGEDITDSSDVSIKFEEDEDSPSDSEEEDDDNEAENDIYLNLFSKRKYRTKFKKLMNVYNDKGQEEFEKYFKEDYIKSDKGYKQLLKKMTNLSDEEKSNINNELLNEVIENGDLFEPYIPKSKCLSSSNETEIGTVSEEESDTENLADSSSGAITYSSIIKGIPYVNIKDSSSKSISEIKSASSLYGTDSNSMPLSRYVMGVVYAEIGSTNESAVKSQMIAAQSFLLGRTQTSACKDGCVGMGFTPDYQDGKTIMYIRGNTNDQAFCDIYEGCKSGIYTNSSISKDAMSKENVANFEKWYNEISNYFIYDSKNNVFTSAYKKNYDQSGCTKGICMSQDSIISSSNKESDFKNLLFDSDNGGYDNNRFVLYKSEDDSLNAITTSEEIDCPSNNCGVSGTRDEIVTFARSMVGKISYYFGGKPSGPNYEDNNFGATVKADYKGRNKRGLDCSGFVDFVFWHVTSENFGLGNTSEIRDQYSTEISYDDLKPGDIGFLDKSGSGTNQHVGIYVGKDSSGKDIWIDCNASNGVQEHNTGEFKVYYRPKILDGTDDSNTNTCESSSGAFSCKTYNLSSSELNGLASIAYAEQGSVEGAKAEASLMANKYELAKSSRTLYDYVYDGGKRNWWSADSKTNVNKKTKKEVVDGVKDVLVNGNRSFPSYVNEHDCISCGSYGFDIIKLDVGGKVYTSSKDLLNHDNYIQHKTVIYNRYSTKYTFYSFPTKGSDPFGYTKKTKDTCNASSSGVQGDGLSKGTLVHPLKSKGSWAQNGVAAELLRYNSGSYHGGNDISVAKGTQVVAMDGGVVIKADTTTNKGKDVKSEGYGHFGKFVLLKHTISGKNYYTVYAHLNSISVKVGDKVSQGQVIGKSGNTGNSTGPHLHIAMSYNTYTNGGAPIYNKNVMSPYKYITGSKKGKSYVGDKGKNY